MTDPIAAAVNAVRGEVSHVLAGVPRKLCLTLGALAEIESAFGLSDWSALAERLKSLSASDLLTVLAALLRGGGEGDAAAQVSRLPIQVPEAAAAVAKAFAAAAGT